MAFEFEAEGVEGEVDVLQEDDEGGDEEEHAAGKEHFHSGHDFHFQEGADEQADDEQTGEQRGARGEPDAQSQELGASVKDGDLLVQGGLFFQGRVIGFLGEVAGAVDDAAEAVGHREEEHADARDQNDRADGHLQIRNDFVQGMGGHT